MTNMTKEEAIMFLVDRNGEYSSAENAINDLNLKSVPKEYYADKNFVMTVLNGVELKNSSHRNTFKNNPYIYPLLSEDLKKDKDVLSVVCKRACYSKDKKTTKFSNKTNSAFGLFDIEKYLPEEVKTHKLLKKMWAAGRKFDYNQLHELLKNDIDICLSHIIIGKRHYYPSKKFDLPDSILNNVDFIIQYTQKIGNHTYMNNKLLGNKDALKIAFTGRGLVEKIVEKIKVAIDSNVIIKNNNKYEYKEYKEDNVLNNILDFLNDKSIFLEYMKSEVSLYGSTYTPIEYFNQDFFKNKELIKEIIKVNPKHYSKLTQELKEDYELALIAVELNDNMAFIKEEFKNDINIVKKAIAFSKEYERPLEFASESIKDNDEIVELTLQKNTYSIRDISTRCANNLNYILMSVKKSDYNKTYVGSDFEIIKHSTNPVKTTESLILKNKIEDSVVFNNTVVKKNKI